MVNIYVEVRPVYRYGRRTTTTVGRKLNKFRSESLKHLLRQQVLFRSRKFQKINSVRICIGAELNKRVFIRNILYCRKKKFFAADASTNVEKLRGVPQNYYYIYTSLPSFVSRLRRYFKLFYLVYYGSLMLLKAGSFQNIEFLKKI